MKEKNKNQTNDVLEAYPEKQQVDAFPERRYVRLTRFLAIITIINLGIIVALSGIYFYLARNKDISIGQRNWLQIYTIDPEKKILLPSEYGQRAVSAMQLAMEAALRRYLTERYETVWDVDTMRQRWGEDGFVARLSSEDVLAQFAQEAARSWKNDIQQKRITRDVHIYSLYPIHSDLWTAYIETFDFSLSENLEKTCDCSDNSHECLACKEKNMISGGRKRRKILLRANFKGPKTLKNPLGVMVYAYYPALVPIPKEQKDSEKFWDLPPPLRPEL